MAYLSREKKVDLLNLAIELGFTVNSDVKVIELKNIITQSVEYDIDFTKGLIETIRIDRLEREQRETEQTQRDRDFELEKLRLEAGNGHTIENGDVQRRVHRQTVDMHKLIPRFDPEKGEIGLYLVLFERQATRAGLDKAEWATQLNTLLPMEIVQLITREPEEVAQDYDHVRKILLDRYKLSPESFRQKFFAHKKKDDMSWKDYTFEEKNYFFEWIKGVGVADFEALTELIITDQIKRRVPIEMKEHFADSWGTLNSSDALAGLLDNYESVRKTNRRVLEKPRFERPQSNTFPEKNRVQLGDRPQTQPHSLKTGRDARPGRESHDTREAKPGRESYDTRRSLRCFICHSPSHMKYQCPRFKQDRRDLNSLNRMEDPTTEYLRPYLKKGWINGKEVEFLRDSGASLDLVNREFVKPECYRAEVVWVKQPLDAHHRCLPLANVTIKGDFGTITTTAAVCGDTLEQGRYLLGNKTAQLIKEKFGYDFPGFETLNAVQTRLQARLTEKEHEPKGKETVFPGIDEGVVGLVAIEKEKDGQELISIPCVDARAPELSLLEVNREDFIKAQRSSPGLRELFKLVSAPKDEKSKSYELENEVLVKLRQDKLGNQTKLLVIPEDLRERVKSLCHEGTSAHLGATKCKDKLARYFYWPNCFGDLDKFVKSCESCQRVGKPNERKKAPLKLVPIIQEVFSKINVDATGPLPTSTNGNKYMITAICMSSKYPEAIPVANIGSEAVTNALLNIFSRIGFPRQIQCDQGTSFTSALTTEFLERFGIKIVHSSVMHPQSNPVERFHRTIKRLLKVLCLEAGNEWDTNLPAALLAIRTVKNVSTGFTPAELVYGRNLRTPETLLFEHWLEPSEENNPVTEYVFKLINRLKRCREVAITTMEDAQIKRKVWYDKHATKREFKEGDLVLILAMAKPNKLAVQWVGPGTVRKKISETNYVVEVPGKKTRSRIYHINMLKPFHKRSEPINLLEGGETEAEMAGHDIGIPYLETGDVEDNVGELTQNGGLENADVADHDIDIPYPGTVGVEYKVGELTQNSGLENLLNQLQIDQLQSLLGRFANCFSDLPGQTDLVVHDIELNSQKPIVARPYRTSYRQNEILKTEIQKMLDLGIIEVGESDYTSPMILVEVPGKDPRPCVDYRRLNAVMRTKFFPLPHLEERVELVASAKYLTVLDLTKGYFQIPLSRNAQRLAAFCTSFGVYRPLKLMFGLRNAPYIFSKLMSELLKDCEKFAIPYLDDIAIFSNTWDAHLEHLGTVLERIEFAKLTIKPSKCRFAQNHAKYLGHVVGQGFRAPAEAKIQSILEFPTPKTKTQIRAFLGITGYYSRYIPMYSVIAAPLTDTLKGRVKKGTIAWTPECEGAFKMLKEKLTNEPVLYAPDFTKDFIVHTDASDRGMGVVLSQVNEQGEEHPVLYLSKKFSTAEQKYCATERECASIIFAVKRLHFYLDGRNFTIVTDHKPLVWLNKNASSNSRLMRWALTLQPYDFQILHRPGTLNMNADGLSRAHSPPTGDKPKAKLSSKVSSDGRKRVPAGKLTRQA